MYRVKREGALKAHTLKKLNKRDDILSEKAVTEKWQANVESLPNKQGSRTSPLAHLISFCQDKLYCSSHTKCDAAC